MLSPIFKKVWLSCQQHYMQPQSDIPIPNTFANLTCQTFSFHQFVSALHSVAFFLCLDKSLPPSVVLNLWVYLMQSISFCVLTSLLSLSCECPSLHGCILSMSSPSLDNMLKYGKNLARSVLISPLLHSPSHPCLPSRSTSKMSRAQTVLVPYKWQKAQPRRCRIRAIWTQDKWYHHMCHNFPCTLLSLSLPSVTTPSDTHFFYQEFGIDIIGEDRKTIVHRKVAACIICMLTK